MVMDPSLQPPSFSTALVGQRMVTLFLVLLHLVPLLLFIYNVLYAGTLFSLSGHLAVGNSARYPYGNQL